MLHLYYGLLLLSLIASFPEKKKVLTTMSACVSEMSNIEYWAVIKIFIWKELNATEITNHEFKYPAHGSEDAPQIGCPLTTTTDEKVEVMECVVMSLTFDISDKER